MRRLSITFSLFIITILSIGLGCRAETTAPTPAATAVSLSSNATPTPSPTATDLAPTDTPTPPTATAVEEQIGEANDTVEETAVPITTPIDPTATIPPTDTPIPTITPTSQPQFTPERIIVEGEGIPTPVPEFVIPDDTTTILLLGNDGGVNTDTIMIVAINRQGPTASILSLPRDLYVYIPGKGYGRINTVVARGGPQLLKQTIQYNFGVPIHFYAQVDFDGFKDAVDIFNGVEVAVSCELTDWRLKSPELDPEEEDNWEQFTLEPGVHQMDGDLALWYVRSRLTTSDFDRGRRQQQLIRAMLDQAVDVGIVSEFPSLWGAYQDNFNTDMDIGRILQIASLAPAIDENGVQHLYVARKTEEFITPDGSNVLRPIWEGERMMKEEFSRLFLPPALNMAARPPITVEVVNASGDPDLAVLAADNLAWFGFTPVLGEETAVGLSPTSLSYYKPNFKGSFDWLISWIFDLDRDEIELAEDESYAYDYRLVVGEDYEPCRPVMLAPQPFLP